MILDKIKSLQATGFLGSLDTQVASLAKRMVPSAADHAILAAALTSRAITLGHACVNLTDYAGKKWQDILARELPRQQDLGASEAPLATSDEAYTRLPALPATRQEWLQALPESLFGNGSETGKARTLFIQHQTRLYLRRYWNYERTVENKLTQLHQQAGSQQVHDDILAIYFGDQPNDQKTAARQAVESKLSLLSGGPGTGKTYTLARAVAMLGDLNAESCIPPIVRLVAPTGKAAVRMKASIKQAKLELLEELKRNGLPCSHIEAIPEDATTIHRFLGARYQSAYFKHDASNPVVANMVIVDEASMVDLPLMAKLLDALPPDCALMLVGDIDQLASVEPGRVYGDLCHAATNHPTLKGCLTRLTKSRRFPEGSPIGIISKLVNNGQAEEAWQNLQAHADSPDLKLHDSRTLRQDVNSFTTLVKDQLKAFAAAKDAAAALHAAGQFRVLCARHRGPYGVSAMNKRIEAVLATMGITPRRPLYDHQLIMIKTNTPSQNLYNGDVGVILATPNATNKFQAWFPDADKGVRPLPVALLPEYETAFAMTVHKSQGSEFPHVLLILPEDPNTPVLTRELLYTGMTRVAINPQQQTGRLHLWSTETSFKQAILKQTARTSGLFLPSASSSS